MIYIKNIYIYKSTVIIKIHEKTCKLTMIHDQLANYEKQTKKTL